jgi:hypothetical protein
MAIGGAGNPNEPTANFDHDQMLTARKLGSSSAVSLSPDEARVKDMLMQSASLKN